MSPRVFAVAAQWSNGLYHLCFERFGGLSDWRTRKSDFALSSLITVSVCALLCKVCLGQRDLAAFAADLTVEQMEALGLPRDWRSRQRRYRLLSQLRESAIMVNGCAQLALAVR